MGRPIKKTFFANLNREFHGSVVLGSGVGGEGVASVAISNSGTLYSQGATVSVSAPQITGGVAATGTLTIPASGTNSGKIMAVNITNSGSGYLTAPTVTVTTASLVTQYVSNSGVTATNTLSVASVVGIQIGMRIYGGGNGGLVTAVDPVLNRVTSSLPNDTSWTNASNLKFYDQGSGFADSVTLTTTRPNGLMFCSRLSGGSVRATGDIVKQEASRRYLVKNADGEGQCTLVTTSTLAAGQMNIVATDWNGSTYYVRKLTAHRAVLVTSTASGGGFLIANGASTGWTIGAATGTVVTLAHTN